MMKLDIQFFAVPDHKVSKTRKRKTIDVTKFIICERASWRACLFCWQKQNRDFKSSGRTTHKFYFKEGQK